MGCPELPIEYFFVDTDSKEYNYELTVDYSLLRMGKSPEWLLLTPSRYIGEKPPEDEPKAQMFKSSQAIREIKAGTKFRIVKITRLPPSDREYCGEAFCSMKMELDNPDKLVCNLTMNAYELGPLTFYPNYAKPVDAQRTGKLQ